MEEKCLKCNSTNIYREWTKVGTFVSYYNLICKDCGNKEMKRTSDPM